MTNHWTVTPLTEGLGAFAGDWDSLNRKRFRDNPMLDSRFVDGLLKYFGSDDTHLCTLHADHDAGPIAMCVLRPRGGGIWTTFLPSQAQIGPVLLDVPGAMHSLMRELPGMVGGIDILCHDPAFGDLSAGNAGTRSTEHALTMNISLIGDFSTYWAQRSKQLQKNFRRYQRRLEADHVAPRFLCITDKDEMASAVVRYGTLETKGWKGKLGTAVGTDNAQGLFYGDILARFAATSNALVYELWLGDILAASRLAISGNEMIVILKTTYDESLDKYAPGRLLLREVVQDAFMRHPGKAIEFYTDANADQLAWATGQRWITHVNFPRSAFAASIYWVGRMGRRTFRATRNIASDLPLPPKIDVYEHPDQLPSDVVELFDQCQTENFELGVPWYCNLVNAVYANEDAVKIYVARSGGRPVAALPVLARKGAFGNRIESLSNYYTSIYSPALASNVKAADLTMLIRTVCDANAPLASLQFSPMDPQSTAYNSLREALSAAHLVPYEFFCFGNWYLTVNGNWEAYLMGRTGTLRSTIKRMSKKFMGDGGTLELVQDGQNIDQALAAYEQVYAASWKNAEPYPQFVTGLVKICIERGWLRMGIAWLNGKPIAAQLWIVSNEKASIYKVAYDENFKAYAPGTLLTAMLMQHVMENDVVKKVDYLIGDDPYKKTWMSHRQERWGIVAYNPRTARGLIAMLREVLGRTLKPWLTKMKKRD